VKGMNMEADGGSFISSDLEDYVTHERHTCFNMLLGSNEVGQAYGDP
jgi:hypothetical protein